MAEEIVTLPKNKRERLRIALDNWQGVPLVDLRCVVQLSESSGIWTPTKKGVSFRQDMLPDVIEALQAAQGRIEETA